MSRESIARRRVKVESLVEDGPHKYQEAIEEVELLMFELHLMILEERLNDQSCTDSPDCY